MSGAFVDAICSNGMIMVYTTSNAYAFTQGQSAFDGNPNNVGTWTSQSLTGTPVDAIPTK
jgi:hypothetical protein